MQIWVLTDRLCLQERMPRALTGCLTQSGSHGLRIVIADDGAQVSMLSGPPGQSVWEGLEPEDLLLVRSRHPFALALLQEAESLGARTVFGSAAVRRVRDKVRAVLTLEERGLPTPETFVACRPQDLTRLRPRFPLLLKGREGVRLVRTSQELADVEWDEPVVLAQRYVNSGAAGVRLYVAGDHVWAVRRPSSLTGGEGPPVEISVDPGLGWLARRCADAFELPLLAIDVVRDDEGPLIVDVNEFPNYTGIAEAPEVIAQLLLGYAYQEPGVVGSHA